MHQRWTLHVEKFARFKEASVAVRPLTLLVGENNSGKSYMAMLLWGLLARGATFFPSRPVESKAYSRCVEVLRDCRERAVASKLGGEEGSTALGAEEALVFVDWFNELLHKHRKHLVAKVFGNGSLTIGDIRVVSYSRTQPLSLGFVEGEETICSARGEQVVRLSISDWGRAPDLNWLHDGVCELAGRLIFGGTAATRPQRGISTFSDGEPLFLPASRTGFMLTYRSLVGEALSMFDASLGHTPSATQFSWPVVRFLQALTRGPYGGRAPYRAIAEWLEDALLAGRIEQVASGNLPDYRYRPAEPDAASLPMYLSSSLVSELAPVVHFLKHRPGFRSLVIEEPEAHLHPQAQRLMARALVRLVNAGLPVIATTHGDTLFQQINNLAQLHVHPRRKALCEELGYLKEETLSPDLLGVSQFRREAAGTTVSALPVSPWGVAVPTFNESLAALTREIHLLQEGLDSGSEAGHD